VKKLKKHYTSIILTGYIFFLLFLLTTGTIRRFINPRLSFLSILALLMLGGMLFASFKDSKANEHDQQCECCHHEEKQFPKGNLILLLPLLLSMFVPPDTLSYQQPNDQHQPSGNIPQIKTSGQPGQPANWKISSLENNLAQSEYEEYTQLNIGDIIFDTLKAPKQKLLNSKIFLQGIALHSNQLKENEIVVYRMVISCCAADGMPLGVTIKLPEGTKFTDGEWIGVEGTIQFLPFKEDLKNLEPVAYMVPPEKIYPYLMATKAYRIKAPEEQYLFP
jgi:putative membrane protein